MILTFIGNCQTLSLCFYFQQLLNNENDNVFWILYGEEFKQHLGNWSDKCKNKIYDYDCAVQQIKNSDFIIYQEIKTNKSAISNTIFLQEHKKDDCRLIKIPSIYFDYNDFDNSLLQLQTLETTNNTDIKVSNILNRYKNYTLMLTINHPKTSLFLQLVNELCILINIPFFSKKQYYFFLKNKNFMELP
jgi:hypothetical protein